MIDFGVQKKGIRELAQEGLSEQAALKDHLQKATSALKKIKVQLKDAQMISLLNSMKRLRDIEGRGNVKVDRQSGRVTPVRPIEFLPETPPKEKGPFKVTWICIVSSDTFPLDPIGSSSRDMGHLVQIQVHLFSLSLTFCKFFR